LRRFAIGAIVIAAPACTAILGLPDPMVDPNFGLIDGAYADGFVPDNVVQKDGSSDTTNDGAMNDVTMGDSGCCFGGGCTDSGKCLPIQLVTNITDPNLIDNDNTNVYVVSGANAIVRLNPNMADAGVTTIANGSFIKDLKVSGAYFYFTDSVQNKVSRCATVTGCGPRLDYTTNRNPYGVAVDGTNVYFTDNGSSYGIYSCALNGCGMPTKISSAQKSAGIVTDGSKLFWFYDDAINTGVHICTTPSCGGPFYGMNTGVVDIGFDANNIYFSDATTIYRETKAGANQAPIATGTNIRSVRADAKFVYWTDEGLGVVRRCPIGVDCTVNMAKIDTVASSLMQVYGLTLSNDSIYFTTRMDGTIWRVGKY